MKNLLKIFSFVAVIGGGALLVYSFYRAQTSLPRLLEKIYSEDMTDRFRSYATRISAQQNLQVARLNRVEVYERTSKAQAFGFSLPEVVVSVSFPVEYNYGISLTAPWRFAKEEGMLVVYPPELSGQTPAVNISEMKFEVKKGSILRDEDHVKERLQKELTGYLAGNSIALRSQVRAEARKSVERFVRSWLGTQFSERATILPIKVLFPGENSDTVPSAAP